MKYRSSLILTIFALFIAVNCCFGQAGQVDPTFSASVQYGANGPVYAFKTQPDGKVLVGGSFTAVNGIAASCIVRLNLDGSVDTTFTTPDFYSSDQPLITTIALQPDGKILVAGGFAGHLVPSLIMARLNADGSPDLSFSSPFSGGQAIYAIDGQPDGTIIVGGSFTVANKTNLVRLNADGSVNSGFTADFGGIVRSVVSLGNGQILAGGSYSAGGQGFVVRLNSNGSLDNSYGVVGLDTTLYTMRAQSDGKVLLGGPFTILNSFVVNRIARLNTDGTRDTTFNVGGSGANTTIYALQLDADGRILVGGIFTQYNGVSKARVARLNSDGTLDITFTATLGNSTTQVNAVEPTMASKVLVGFNNFFYPYYSGFVRLNDTGSTDAVYLSGRTFIAGQILQQPDGKILVCGAFDTANNTPRAGLVRFNPDGTLDTTFVPTFGVVSIYVYAIALQPDGKILVGRLLNNSPPLSRLNSDGSPDPTFVPSSLNSGGVHDIVVQSNGQILVGGGMRSPTGASYHLVRLNANGSLSSSFGAAQLDRAVRKIVIQPNGKIIVAGGNSTAGIARINTDGTRDITFGGSVGGGNIYDMDQQADGKIVVVGDFTSLNGSNTRIHVGRLSADGYLDPGFVQFTDGGLFAVKVLPDQKILIGGGMGYPGGIFRAGIARLNTDGAVDTTFTANTNRAVGDLSLQSDGKILAAGEFTRINGTPRVAVARLLDSAASAIPLFDFDGDGRADISVTRPGNSYIWYQLLGPNYTFSETPFGLPGDVVTPADFDGDGITDIAIFRPAWGDWWWRSSINGQHQTAHWGASGDIPLPGDIDGDGKADFVVYRNGTWYRLVNGGTSSSTPFGAAGDKPLLADFDGDGKADLAIFRPSTGTFWYAASSQGGAHRGVQWGISTDVPVPADYDGDGTTDFAVYRPSEGAWYVLNSSNGSFLALPFGVSEDRPIPADYDGDGRADIAVYRPSTGIWYLLQSNSGFTGFQWGNSTDIPSPAAYIPQ